MSRPVWRNLWALAPGLALDRRTSRQGKFNVAIRITDDMMTLEIGDRGVATARFSEHTVAEGKRRVACLDHPARLFTRDQAITTLTVAELGESGQPDSHPLVVALREELR